MHYISHYQSPIGDILLAADDTGLTGLWFEGQKYFARCLDKNREEKEVPVLEAAKRWLDLYFSGKEPDFSVPLHFIGTDFQKQVWEILCTIPYGRTTTYGDIAKRFAAKKGLPHMSAQAIGGAVGHNEISIIVPCHRVVGSDGSLTGYAGGVDKKRALLTLEGVDMSGLHLPAKGYQGFGEVTIPRYLEGQVPSKEYSDIVKAALVSPAYMKQKLTENREKLTDAAYKKAMAAADSIESLFSVSDRMLRVIAYIFEKLEEVTPLMLQKLLYFIQGIYSALYGKPIFTEDCRAWIHGPVYPEVYDLFRDFKYTPIDDARFALLEGKDDALTDDEKRVIDLVVNTFGMYGGKVLEKITHNEEPWREARKGYGDSIPSSELLPKEGIKKYYMAVNEKYGMDKEEGIQSYIRDMLRKAS